MGTAPLNANEQRLRLEQLAALRLLLLNHDLAALGSFKALSVELHDALDAERFEQLREGVNNLNFALAATLLPRAVA